jgi:hypothetical protein
MSVCNHVEWNDDIHFVVGEKREIRQEIVFWVEFVDRQVKDMAFL